MIKQYVLSNPQLNQLVSNPELMKKLMRLNPVQVN